MRSTANVRKTSERPASGRALAVDHLALTSPIAAVTPTGPMPSAQRLEFYLKFDLAWAGIPDNAGARTPTNGTYAAHILRLQVDCTGYIHRSSRRSAFTTANPSAAT